MKRLTIRSTGANGYALDLDNPQNELEARKQLMEKFKIAVNKLAEFENFMEEYGFESLDDLKEEEIIQENHTLKKAYLSACKKLSEVFGECPYSNMDLQMPDYCEEECGNNEKYLCWDKYFIEQAKGEKNDRS